MLTWSELGEQSTQAKKVYLPSGSAWSVCLSRQKSLHEVLSQYLMKRANALVNSTLPILMFNLFESLASSNDPRFSKEAKSWYADEVILRSTTGYPYWTVERGQLLSELRVCESELQVARNNWKQSMLQELGRVGYSWERAKASAQNRVRWRVIADAVCYPGVIKDNYYNEWRILRVLCALLAHNSIKTPPEVKFQARCTLHMPKPSSHWSHVALRTWVFECCCCVQNVSINHSCFKEHVVIFS